VKRHLNNLTWVLTYLQLTFRFPAESQHAHNAHECTSRWLAPPPWAPAAVTSSLKQLGPASVVNVIFLQYVCVCVCDQVVQSLHLAYAMIVKAIHMILLLPMTSCQSKMFLLLVMQQQALRLVHHQACHSFQECCLKRSGTLTSCWTCSTSDVVMQVWTQFASTVAQQQQVTSRCS